MLNPYRRHLKTCAHRAEGRSYRRCSCPVWCDGTLNGREFRRSLSTRDWDEAQQRLRQWEEARAPRKPEVQNPTVKDLEAAYTADMRARGLADSGARRYEQLLRQMVAYSVEKDLSFLSAWDLQATRTFRESWKDTGTGADKKRERLCTIQRFAVENGWLKENYAAKLARPVIRVKPTLPYDADEMRAILVACDGYRGKHRELRALCLLMRYSGLRIQDALTLARDRVVDGKLFLYTQKTEVPVWVPLPPVVLEALATLPAGNPRYYFWNGQSEPGAFSRLWMKKLNVVFERASAALVEAGRPAMAKGHSHRFRDTFAVALLLAGRPIERVSVLLGHRSVRVTERHYAPWVRARQEQAEADVRESWSGDPLAGAERAKVVSIKG